MTQTPQLQPDSKRARRAPGQRHRLRGWALAAVTIGLLVPAIYFASAAGPAAPAKASSTPAGVLFFIDHLPAGRAVKLSFDRADSTIDNGLFAVDPLDNDGGGISFFTWTADQVTMSAKTDPPRLFELKATFALVRGGPITGTAVVPPNAKVTTIGPDGKQLALDGKFSIPTSGWAASTH